MSALLAALRDVLVPPRCAGCGDPGAWFCVGCRDLCEPARVVAGRLAIHGAGVHEGPLRDAVHRLKYRGEPGLATELGALVAARVAADLAAGVPLDAVVPVALHRARAAERGYDQAGLLAEAVARGLALPLRHALHRIRAGAPQVRLDRTARRENVRGAFVASRGSLRGLRLALIDDVATTGATLGAAAAAARAAGALSVRAYVVAIDA